MPENFIVSKNRYIFARLWNLGSCDGVGQSGRATGHATFSVVDQEKGTTFYICNHRLKNGMCNQLGSQGKVCPALNTRSSDWNE